jgi:DNA-binding transcriptional ArsR family regulator
VARTSSARKPEATARGPDGRGRLAAVRGRGAAQAASLDQVIHERKRLAIVSALAVHDSLSFTELKALVGITDGNLSVHARKLEDAGYVECRKGFAGRVPRTDFRLTSAGRRALDGYLDHMEALIRRTRDG